MPWSANDIALVITASSTAIAAIAGLILPAIRERRISDRQKREQQYDRLLEALTDVMAVVDNAALAYQDQKLSIAMMEAGHEQDRADRDQSRSLLREYHSVIRRVYLLAEDIGVDPSDFNMRVTYVATLAPDYKVEDGVLMKSANHDEVAQARAAELDALTKDAAELLVGARQKLKL